MTISRAIKERIDALESAIEAFKPISVKAKKDGTVHFVCGDYPVVILPRAALRERDSERV